MKLSAKSSPFLLALLACLIPALIALLYIKAYGVNVPVVDDFVFVNGFNDWYSGKLSPQFFLGLHNGHCLFFGKIVMLALGFITHFNIVAEMYLSWIFLLLTLFLLMHIVIKTFGTTFKSTALCIPASLLIFGLRPWDVFINGSVFLNSMTIFFVTASITALFHTRREKPSPAFFIALLSGIIGSFSGSASGLLVWFIGLVQLAGFPLRRQLEYATVRIWLACCVFAFGGYACLSWLSHKAPSPVLPHDPLGTAILHKLVAIPPYLLTLCGFPFCTLPASTQVCGAIVIAIYLCFAGFLLFKRPFGQHDHALRAGIAVFLYGALAMGLVTIARSERGYLEAMASRYAQFSNIMLLGAYLILCFSDIKPAMVRRLIFVAVLLLVGTASFAGYSTALFNGTYWRNLQLKNAYLLRTNEIQVDEDLKALQSNPYFVRFQAEVLKRHKLSIFNRAASQSGLDNIPFTKQEPAYCLDLPAGSAPNETTAKTPSEISIQRNSPKSISISGWAFDANSGAPAKRVALLLDQESQVPTIVPACYGLRYPGVAESFKNKRLSDCGFYASFSPSILVPGEHTICLAVESTGGQQIAVSKQVLRVKILQ
ncbi:MAG TPA: hypothetical protein V6C86_03120 [Oculatellaceae cyanobacterium]